MVASGSGGKYCTYNSGGGGYTGGNGSGFCEASGGGGGSFLADPKGTRQLEWYDEGNCSIEYIGRRFLSVFPQE